MKRREIREHLLRMLFCKEFHSEEERKEQMEFYFANLEEPAQEDLAYLGQRYEDICEKLTDIDQKIASVSSGWKLSRIGRVEMALLRIATYEILYDDEVPTGVAINEAVEIAKRFGGDDSPSFVNGILAKLV